MILPAISIRQPWAYCILHLGKDVENRTWNLPEKYIGKDILLHTGKGVNAKAVEQLRAIGFVIPDVLPTGGIVGTLNFSGCIRDSLSPWAHLDCENWEILKAKALPFFACLGRLNFFKVDYPFSLEESHG